MREITLQQAAQTALDVQTACNLSGVAQSFAEITAALRASGLDTPTTNTHPVCRLFAEQILHLTGGGTGDMTSYETAYAACTTLAKAQPQPAPDPLGARVTETLKTLAQLFGDEWTALDKADQDLIMRDCFEDGGVDDLREYARSIGGGNLASYVKTQRVRFAAPWVIVSRPLVTGERAYWSNADGWTTREGADTFTDNERQTLRLPIGGEWRKGE